MASEAAPIWPGPVFKQGHDFHMIITNFMAGSRLIIMTRLVTKCFRRDCICPDVLVLWHFSQSKSHV